MRTLRFLLAAASLIAGNAFGSPSNPANGAEYATLTAPQPVQAPAPKIEVVEFFMYHCPACMALEPALLDWVKKQGDRIVFRRIHLPMTGPSDPEAHLFLTLEAMGTEAALHDKVLHVWHVEQKRLKDDNDNIAWAVANGIDKAKFVDVYNSFGVLTRLRGATRVAANYQVDSTPTLVIDGRYLTNPSMVEANNAGLPRQDLGAATLQVADALVTKAIKSKAH